MNAAETHETLKNAELQMLASKRQTKAYVPKENSDFDADFQEVQSLYNQCKKHRGKEKMWVPKLYKLFLHHLAFVDYWHCMYKNQYYFLRPGYYLPRPGESVSETKIRIDHYKDKLFDPTKCEDPEVLLCHDLVKFLSKKKNFDLSANPPKTGAVRTPTV